MDESLSKALIIVAGVLLAMLVIAFFTYSFNQIGAWSAVSEEEKILEQKEKFNKEYEVYDKSLMYGVDVISCLNKVKSNNDKITNHYEEALDESYEIQVSMEIKKPLEESIKVYHMANDSNNKIVEISYSNGEKPTKDNRYKIEDIFNINEQYKKSISNIKFNEYIQHIVGKETKIDKGVYTLTAKDATTSPKLKALLTLSSEVKRERKNNFYGSTPNDPNSWTKAVWETAIYDLKTRKFKCVSFKYSEKTGIVNYIGFQEIKKGE